MYPALFLFIAARANSNIKRLIRHPQLSALVLWGAAHLLANGESRSLVLFGTFALWALIQMFFINRRDGAWQKPDPVPLSRDIIVGVIALVVYTALVFGHGYFSGVPLILWQPGSIPSGRSIEQTVQSIDLAPTILSISDLRVPSTVQGHSLVPLFRGRDRWTTRPAGSRSPCTRRLSCHGARFRWRRRLPRRLPLARS